MNKEQLLEAISKLVDRKGRPAKFEVGHNAWLVQVILDNQWSHVYYAPTGIKPDPEYIAESLDVAYTEALSKAYYKFLEYNKD